jgi:hypothetical protein
LAAKKTTLTPELAKQLLGNLHPKQRKSSRQQVAKYVRAMRNGTWRNENPDPILIDKATGKMFNGAHRCQAVVDSGITIEVMIDYQSDATLFDFIDTGLGRSAGQFIQAGSAFTRASATRIVLWQESLLTRDRPLGGLNSYWQMSEVTERAIELNDIYDRLLPFSAQVYSRTGMSQSAILAAITIATTMGLEEKAIEFCEQVANPVLLMPYDPAWILFDRMSRSHNRDRRRQTIDDWTIFVRCLNAHLNDERLPKGGVRMTMLWPRVGESEKDFNRRLGNAASLSAKRRKTPVN